jgi:hypothetical protein
MAHPQQTTPLRGLKLTFVQVHANILAGMDVSLLPIFHLMQELTSRGWESGFLQGRFRKKNLTLVVLPGNED